MSASWLFHSLKKLRYWLKKVVQLILLSDRPTSNMRLAATLPYHLWVPQAQDLSTESWCSWVPSKKNKFKKPISSRCFVIFSLIFNNRISISQNVRVMLQPVGPSKSWIFHCLPVRFFFSADSVWNLKSKRWPSAVGDDCLHSTIFWRVTLSVQKLAKAPILGCSFGCARVDPEEPVLGTNSWIY